MRQIQVKQLDYELTATAGLALVGQLLKTLEPVRAEVDAALPVRAGVASSDIVRSYLGLQVQGKSDFDASRTCAGMPSSAGASTPTVRSRSAASQGSETLARC